GVRPPLTTMGWPVRGFRPRRGLRRVTENVPKPTSVTGCPRLSEVRMAARRARRAQSAAVLLQPLASAMAATISAPSPMTSPHLGLRQRGPDTSRAGERAQERGDILGPMRPALVALAGLAAALVLGGARTIPAQDQAETRFPVNPPPGGEAPGGAAQPQ